MESIGADSRQAGVVRMWALGVAERVSTFQSVGGDEPELSERIGPIAITGNPDLGLVKLEIVSSDRSVDVILPPEDLRDVQPELDDVGRVLLIQPPAREQMREALIKLMQQGIFNESLKRR